jgi:alpha-D-xyloside xylohydrolase
LRIYRGADADFTLYEDEGDTYDYEKGERATIPLHWNDATSTLTIGPRQGSYPGMAAEREFHVVLVGPASGTGIGDSSPAHEVNYKGSDVSVALH